MLGGVTLPFLWLQIYEGVNSLLDKLGVWYHLANGTSDLKEMAQIGLHILIGYSGLEEAQVRRLRDPGGWGPRLASLGAP